MKTIILQGMCYSGKTTLGSLLGEALDLSFVDSRDLFMREHGISEIDYLSSQGRYNFIEAEKKSLRQRFDNMVVSLGGSAIYYPEEMNNLYKEYTIVWLNVPLHIIKERKHLDSMIRPILYPLGIVTFEELYKQRVALYPQYAHKIINVGEKDTPSMVIGKILEILGR